MYMCTVCCLAIGLQSFSPSPAPCLGSRVGCPASYETAQADMHRPLFFYQYDAQSCRGQRVLLQSESYFLCYSKAA